MKNRHRYTKDTQCSGRLHFKLTVQDDVTLIDNTNAFILCLFSLDMLTYIKWCISTMEHFANSTFSLNGTHPVTVPVVCLKRVPSLMCVELERNNWNVIESSETALPALRTAMAADSDFRVERINCRFNKITDSIVLNWFSVSDAFCILSEENACASYNKEVKILRDQYCYYIRNHSH